MVNHWLIYGWLVGGWPTYPSEKSWSSSVGIMTFPTAWKNKKCSKPPIRLIKGCWHFVGENTGTLRKIGTSSNCFYSVLFGFMVLRSVKMRLFLGIDSQIMGNKYHSHLLDIPYLINTQNTLFGWSPRTDLLSDICSSDISSGIVSDMHPDIYPDMIWDSTWHSVFVLTRKLASFRPGGERRWDPRTSGKTQREFFRGSFRRDTTLFPESACEGFFVKKQPL